jgi:hypothetical protein
LTGRLSEVLAAVQPDFFNYETLETRETDCDYEHDHDFLIIRRFRRYTQIPIVRMEIGEKRIVSILRYELMRNGGKKMQPEGLPQNSPGQRPGLMMPPHAPQPEGLLRCSCSLS